jgi:hypothetical protein
MRSSRVLATVFAAAVVFGLSGSASALTTYTDVNTGYWTFSGIQESSSYGDPEPLFAQPLAFGDDLGFLPPNFVAQASGAGGFDATGSQLQLMIEGNTPGQFIETLNFTEFGDIVLTSFPPGGGTAATGTFLSLAGFVTVLEVNNVAVGPTVISFGSAGSGADVIVTYTPGDTTGLPGDAGTTIWSASFSMDIASVVANATKVALSLDNDLFAGSEAGTSAKIQKKVVDGPSIIISVPEPSALALLALGCLALGLRTRRS